MPRAHRVPRVASAPPSHQRDKAVRPPVTGRQRPRRTQQARSSAARERLLNATLEVLIDRGYNGLTTKEVAARAGFSNGALMHHFGTKADLVIAASAHIYDRCIESGKKIASSDKAQAHPLRAYIADCQEVYLGWPFIADHRGAGAGAHRSDPDGAARRVHAALSHAP